MVDDGSQGGGRRQVDLRICMVDDGSQESSRRCCTNVIMVVDEMIGGTKDGRGGERKRWTEA